MGMGGGERVVGVEGGGFFLNKMGIIDKGSWMERGRNQ